MPRLPCWAYQPGLVGDHHELGAEANAELHDDSAHLHLLGGRRADREALRDLLLGAGSGQGRSPLHGTPV